MSALKPFSFARRLTAVTLAALVLMLAMLAVSPDWHEALHADANHADHECAIVLYSGGVTLSVETTVMPAQEIVWSEFCFAAPTAPVFCTPEFVLPPPCGPPSAA